ASQTIDQVLFANYQYTGATLQHALQASAFAVPASIDISLLSSGDTTTATYMASSSLATLGLAYYEQSMALLGTTGPLVLRGALTGLPTNVTLLIDGHTKFRGEISNLPANLSIDLDTAGRTFAYTASSIIDNINAAYVDTTTGPSIVARIDKIPTNMTASWDLGSAPHVHYTASSVIPKVQFFASLQGVETVDPHGNDYVSAEITDIPATLDLLADFPNNHIEGNS